VLVSSHLLAEIDQVCTHVGMMSAGRLVLQGSRSDLAALDHQRRPRRIEVTTTVAHGPTARRVLTEQGLTDVRDSATRNGATRTGTAPDTTTLTAVLDGAPTPVITKALVDAEVPVAELHVRESSLEEVFVELTGEGFDVAR
jgi:ABC-2 type transport system ATP-binding protein